jgi:VCBS repeat protein/ASPIC/UnbV protein
MKNITLLPYAGLFVLAGFNVSCNQPIPADPPKPGEESGTVQMVKLLKEANEKIDPMKTNYYFNSIRAEKYKAGMESATDNNEKLTNNLYYAYELLSAGKNERAVVEFEKMLKIVKELGMDKASIFQIKRMLALSYVRIGETSNCIERYNYESCIMPIEGKGIYTIREGCLAALKIYEEMLEEDPENYESIWMLNFVYMTLGEYPGKVPKKWLIPASSFKSDYDLPAFKNISDKIGVNTLGLSGGACVEDFNNDGLLDIIASSWGVNDQMRFYVNNGDATFSDKTEESGLTGLTGGLNTQHADYNNDGFVDVLVLRGAWCGTEGNIPNSLIRNNGDGTFTDVTVKAGILNYAPTQTAAWADFNNDGWLDLFIGNESGEGFTNPCEFYFNNKDGTFTNRINETGLGDFSAFVKGCAAGDINNDGWVDLYISVLAGQNKLWLNNGAGGKVTFSDITNSSKADGPVVSFPCWMFDFNNDGWEDILVAGFGTEEHLVAADYAALNYKGKFAGGNPHLYINNGGNRFTNISEKAGLTEALYVMGSNYGDIDNDGWLDCYFGTGAPSYTAIVPNKMFRNNGGTSFQDVTTAGRFGHIQKGHGIGFGDFDNDGDQDIFSVFGGAFEGDVFGDAFFLNPVGNEKSWVTLKLSGTKANKSAIRSRVKVTTINKAGRERAIYATVSTGSSFGGNSLQLELGLDDAVEIKSVEVRWQGPEYKRETFNDIKINSFVKITEGAGIVEYYEPKRFQFPW